MKLDLPLPSYARGGGEHVSNAILAIDGESGKRK